MRYRERRTGENEQQENERNGSLTESESISKVEGK